MWAAAVRPRLTPAPPPPLPPPPPPRSAQNLFELLPEAEELFSGTNRAAQSMRLMDTLNVAVLKLDDPATLVPVLKALGARHAMFYGVIESHCEL